MNEQAGEWAIEFYANARGESPVKDLLAGLPRSEQAKIYNHLRLLREFGTGLGMPHARPLKGHRPLWELRPFPNRVIYFAYTGRRFVVLHVFKKKRQQTPLKEIRTAERRMADWTRRQE